MAVLVTYNRKEWLIQCVAHLRNQSRPLDRIIVVDNGSTDGSEEWLLHQDDLHVVRQENMGGAGGFYKGVQEAYQDGVKGKMGKLEIVKSQS